MSINDISFSISTNINSDNINVSNCNSGILSSDTRFQLPTVESQPPSSFGFNGGLV